MLQRLRLLSVLVLTAVSVNVALGSEEWMAHTHKVSIWADAGQHFGEVSATLQTTGAQPNHRIKSITLTVRGKKIVVPQASFKNLRRPQISTATFRTDAGGSRRGEKDSGSPWLYLVFRLENPRAKSASDYSNVYIRFRDGKLQTTQVWPSPAAVRESD
jgi:hypothetical protein